LKCSVYEVGALKAYKYTVIFARYNNKWLLSRHKGRDTWENAGGHIEKGETPVDCAKRELYEETGALKYSISAICDYWACDEPHETDNISWANGQAFYAEIDEIGELPGYEMEAIKLFDEYPLNITYKDITAELLPKIIDYLNKSKGI
jgi:8-oxo-dGTP diphosphatase